MCLPVARLSRNSSSLSRLQTSENLYDVSSEAIGYKRVIKSVLFIDTLNGRSAKHAYRSVPSTDTRFTLSPLCQVAVKPCLHQNPRSSSICHPSGKIGLQAKHRVSPRHRSLTFSWTSISLLPEIRCSVSAAFSSAHDLFSRTRRFISSRAYPSLVNRLHFSKPARDLACTRAAAKVSPRASIARRYRSIRLDR